MSSGVTEVSCERRLARRQNVLLLSVLQLVLGLLLGACSLGAALLSHPHIPLHNTAPYWAAAAGVVSGGLGLLAWRHHSNLTATALALVSSTSIVLNLLGAVLTSRVASNLSVNCPCFCCSSPEGCGMGQQSGAGGGGTGSPAGAACPGADPRTVRALMVVVCVECSAACVAATLSTLLALLLLAHRKTSCQRPGDDLADGQTDGFDASAGHGGGGGGNSTNGGGRFLGFRRAAPIQPWFLITGEIQALLPPPYHPPPYSHSDQPAFSNGPMLLFDRPGVEFAWDTDSLPPPYSSRDILTGSRAAVRGESQEIIGQITEDLPRCDCHGGAAAALKKISTANLSSSSKQSLPSSMSMESFYKFRPRKTQSAANVVGTPPIGVHHHACCLVQARCESPCAGATKLRHSGSDGMLKAHAAASTHSNRLSIQSKRRYHSTSILGNMATYRQIREQSMVARLRPAAARRRHRYPVNHQNCPEAAGNPLLSLSSQIANVGLSALEKLMSLGNQLSGTLRPSEVTACYSELVNDRIQEETLSQVLYDENQDNPDAFEEAVLMDEGRIYRAVSQEVLPTRDFRTEVELHRENVELRSTSSIDSLERRSSQSEDKQSENEYHVFNFDSSSECRPQNEHRIKSESMDSLPPSRYDYPAFLTIPRKPRLSSNASSSSSSRRSSVDDPGIMSGSSIEVEKCADVNVRGPQRLLFANDYGTARVDRRLCRRDSSSTNEAPVENKPLKNTTVSNEPDRLLRPPQPFQRRLSFDSKRDSGRGGGGGFPVTRSRVHSETTEGNLPPQYHSAADIYASLLNIIQQSQSLIKDLTNQYQQELTAPSSLIGSQQLDASGKSPFNGASKLFTGETYNPTTTPNIHNSAPWIAIPPYMAGSTCMEEPKVSRRSCGYEPVSLLRPDCPERDAYLPASKPSEGDSDRLPLRLPLTVSNVKESFV